MSRHFRFEVLARSRALISAALLAVLVLLAPLAAVSAPLVSVFVNGMRVEAYPIIKDGVAYLPVQVMAQAMESEIVWDAKLGRVKVNGVPSSATVYNQNGKVLLPIESFITGIGGTVVFDGRRNMIRVETADYIANGPGHNATATPTANTVQTAPASTGAVVAGVTSAATAGAVTGTALAQSSTAVTPAVTVNKQAATPAAPVVAPSKGTATTASAGTFNPAPVTAAPAPAPSQSAVATAPQANYGTSASYGYQPATPVQATASARPVTAYNASANNTASFAKAPASTGWNGSQTAVRPVTSSSASSAPGLGATKAAASGTLANSALFIPRTSQNGVFKVTVSNLEVLPVIKDYYKPHAGSKFVVVSLSQQNISNQVQIYTGKFSLVDQNQQSYDHLEGLSNFWLVILRPFGVNFGYLVFEIPQNAKPSSLVLHALNQAPLTINL